VVTSPYNSVLALKQLSEYADCVLPIENQVPHCSPSSQLSPVPFSPSPSLPLHLYFPSCLRIPFSSVSLLLFLPPSFAPPVPLFLSLPPVDLEKTIRKQLTKRGMRGMCLDRHSLISVAESVR